MAVVKNSLKSVLTLSVLSYRRNTAAQRNDSNGRGHDTSYFQVIIHNLKHTYHILYYIPFLPSLFLRFNSSHCSFKYLNYCSGEHVSVGSSWAGLWRLLFVLLFIKAGLSTGGANYLPFSHYNKNWHTHTFGDGWFVWESEKRNIDVCLNIWEIGTYFRVWDIFWKRICNL